jgi:hypothetical protein
MMGVASTGTGAKRFFSFFIAPPRISLAPFHTYFSWHQNNGFLPVTNLFAQPKSNNL